MPKLTAKELGILAEHVETMVQRFPEPEPSDEKDPETMVLPEGFVHEWERFLTRSANEDTRFPYFYNEVDPQLIEYLIDYFNREA